MKRANNIFLHFFDIHYLNEKGINEWKSTIFREASLATRLAVLGADNIIIPAASYFESPLCRSIIDSYSELHFLGLFKLVGNASNLSEFIQLKAAQYRFNKNTFQLYKEIENYDHDIPFFKRQCSSTIDISDQWQSLLLNKEIKPLFCNAPGISIPKNIEYLWHETPEKLAGKPFIVENVFPILFSNQDPNLFATNTLHSFINQYYFNSYTKEFKAGIVSDLVRLEPNYSISGYDLCLPYKYVLNELNLKKKIEAITNATPDELIQIRESDEWLEILISSLKKKELHDYELGLLGKEKTRLFDHKPSTSGQQTTQIIIKGDLNMGDSYQAGQAGAQGPNAHAHDITFNQVWNQNKDDIDLNQLSGELSKLRTELSRQASSPEQHAEIGNIANAEIEANSGNGSKVLDFLSKVGKWSFDTATALGVAIAANTIKIASGQ